MTAVDYTLIAIVALSMLFGVIRGFLRESVALLGWLVGLWLAWHYADKVQPYLGGALAGTELQVWVARLILLLVAIVGAWIIGSLLGYLVQRSGLTLGLDRILGGLFGLVRGAVIVGLVVMLADAARMHDEPWWKSSRLIPVGQDMASVLRGYVETGRDAVENAAAESST
jgi:membrane protein required for colicin V production